jgi:hypothetical protein
MNTNSNIRLRLGAWPNIHPFLCPTLDGSGLLSSSRPFPYSGFPCESSVVHSTPVSCTYTVLERPMPDNYHARTGHALPAQESKVYKQLNSLKEYAEENENQLLKKLLMLFNTVKNLDFMPSIEIDHNEIELVEEMRVLGLIIRSDLKWISNTEQIIIKAFGY